MTTTLTAPAATALDTARQLAKANGYMFVTTYSRTADGALEVVGMMTTEALGRLADVIVSETAETFLALNAEPVDAFPAAMVAAVQLKAHVDVNLDTYAAALSYANRKLLLNPPRTGALFPVGG